MNRQNLLFALVMTCGMSFAQIPVSRTINSPYGPTKVTDYNYRPSNNASINASTLPRYFEAYFTIILKTDSVFSNQSLYDAEHSVHSLTLQDKRQEKSVLKPSDTKQISLLRGGRLLVGIPFDSTYWLFNIVKGRINGYSRLPFATEDYKQIRFIQKGNSGPIKERNLENVREMVADNPKALKLAEKRKLGLAIWKYNTSTR